MYSPRLAVSEAKRTAYSPRLAPSWVSGFASPRSAPSEVLGQRCSPRLAVSDLESELFRSYWSSGEIGAFEDSPVIPYPTLALTIGGVDASDLVQEYELYRPLNGRATCSFKLSLPTDDRGVAIWPSDLAPPGYGDWAGLIRQHRKGLDVLINATISVAGHTINAPEMLPTVPSFSGGQLNWGGEDVTAAADTTVTRDDVVRSAGDVSSAHLEIKSLLGSVGLNGVCKFPNYTINEQRRGRGNLLNWADQLAKLLSAARRTQFGRRVVYESLPKTISPRWVFRDRCNISDFEQSEMELPRDSFTIARVRAVASVAASKKCAGGECIGKQTIRLERPSTYFRVLFDRPPENGVATNFVYRDKDGNALPTGASFVYPGPIPCYSFEFDYVPSIGATAYTPEYELTVKSEPSTPTVAPLEPFEFTAEADTPINPEESNQDNALITDPITGRLCVDELLNASLMLGWAGRLETKWINPEIEPNDGVSVTDAATRNAGTAWLTYGVRIKKVGTEWTQTLDLVRPQ